MDSRQFSASKKGGYTKCGRDAKTTILMRGAPAVIVRPVGQRSTTPICVCTKTRLFGRFYTTPSRVAQASPAGGRRLNPAATENSLLNLQPLLTMPSSMPLCKGGLSTIPEPPPTMKFSRTGSRQGNLELPQRTRKKHFGTCPLEIILSTRGINRTRKRPVRPAREAHPGLTLDFPGGGDFNRRTGRGRREIPS